MKANICGLVRNFVGYLKKILRDYSWVCGDGWSVCECVCHDNFNRIVSCVIFLLLPLALPALQLNKDSESGTFICVSIPYLHHFFFLFRFPNLIYDERKWHERTMIKIFLLLLSTTTSYRVSVLFRHHFFFLFRFPNFIYDERKWHQWTMIKILSFDLKCVLLCWCLVTRAEFSSNTKPHESKGKSRPQRWYLHLYLP